jgi:hypothetical protein
VGTVEAGQGLRDHHGRPLPEAGWDHMRRSA